MHTRLDGLVYKDDGHDPNDHDARQRADDLRTVVPERVLRVRLAARQHQREHAHQEAGHVGEHVRGICHDCKRVREQTADLRSDACKRMMSFCRVFSRCAHARCGKKLKHARARGAQRYYDFGEHEEEADRLADEALLHDEDVAE